MMSIVQHFMNSAIVISLQSVPISNILLEHVVILKSSHHPVGYILYIKISLKMPRCIVIWIQLAVASALASSSDSDSDSVSMTSCVMTFIAAAVGDNVW